MIYLDCAATSFQKPAAVRRAVSDALTRLSSPGRGGYRSAMDAADVLFDAREQAARLLGCSEPERVIFTSNATHALNIAIKSIVKPGATVAVSGYEHNAVMRPLHALRARVRVCASPLFEPQAAVEAFKKALPGADAAICVHVSNVFGYILPIREIAALCRARGVPLIIDASQSAGCLPIDFDALGCRFLAAPGHKGLLGPQGTGILLCADENVSALLEGGTGSESASAAMPRQLPDRLEAGTHNMPGIAGLLAGMRWVEEHGAETISRHEARLHRIAADVLSGARGVTVCESGSDDLQSGVLSFRIDGMDCEETARRLSRRGIAVRAGLHCAPLAHDTAGTFSTGTVRMSFSPFNTEREAERAARSVLEISGRQTDKNY